MALTCQLDLDESAEPQIHEEFPAVSQRMVIVCVRGVGGEA